MTLFRHRFYKNDGTPNALGKVYTYEAGTTTPTETYTSSSASVANTNPIILDNKGEADIWVVGQIKVNVEETNDNGGTYSQVTGWPVDNVGSGVSNNDAQMRWGGTATGTANALAIAPSPSISAYVTGQSFVFKSSANANTAATTISISGLTAITAQMDGAAMAGGEIQANKWYMAVLSSTTVAQISPIGNTRVLVADAAADTTTWPMLATSQTGNQQPATDAGITYNASTNVLTTTGGMTTVTLTATGGGKFTGNPAIDVTTSNVLAWGTAGNPSLAIVDSTRAADSRITEILYTAGTLSFRYVNDAYSAATNWCSVVGTSASITSITFTGTTINLTGNVASTSSISSSSASAGIGYTTGAGGTVTQLTSKSTTVTLNKICGKITTHNAALAANTSVVFQVNNSTVGANYVPIVACASADHTAKVSGITAGSFSICLTNITAGSLSNAVDINFSIITSATS